jgi:hypothetical protein
MRWGISMKITVAGMVATLLLCAAAGTSGYYAGKSAKPASGARAARVSAGRESFTRSLIEVKADISEVLNRKDAYGSLKQIARRFRVASGKYFLALKNLPDSSMHVIDSACLAEADEAIERMKLAIMSVRSCEPVYFQGRSCSSNERAEASDYLLRITSEANETLNRCFDALLDTPTATAAAYR